MTPCTVQGEAAQQEHKAWELQENVLREAEKSFVEKFAGVHSSHKVCRGSVFWHYFFLIFFTTGSSSTGSSNYVFMFLKNLFCLFYLHSFCSCLPEQNILG